MRKIYKSNYSKQFIYVNTSVMNLVNVVEFFKKKQENVS